jgi:3'(2'), 5'-bisphosphate nucleotidase
VAYEKEKEEAVKAARLAARLCLSVQKRLADQDSVEKSDRSLVTVADFGSQALICRHLAEAFGDPIVGEEDAAELRKEENRSLLESVQGYLREVGIEGSAEEVCNWIDQGNGEVSERYWTLDPIDGTKGFLRNDQYAVALALIEDGDIKVGVLACPALPTSDTDGGTLMVAVRGEGTEMMSLAENAGDRVSVDTSGSEESHRFVESVESGHGNQNLQAEVATAVDIHAPSLRMDSQAKYAAVARGDAVLYLRLPSADPNRYAEKIWDHAAGVLVVEEAGGKTTDMHGKSLDFGHGERMTTNRGVVVSNGAIHDDVIAALGRIA